MKLDKKKKQIITILDVLLQFKDMIFMDTWNFKRI